MLAGQGDGNKGHRERGGSVKSAARPGSKPTGHRQNDTHASFLADYMTTHASRCPTRRLIVSTFVWTEMTLNHDRTYGRRQSPEAASRRINRSRLRQSRTVIASPVRLDGITTADIRHRNRYEKPKLTRPICPAATLPAFWRLAARLPLINASSARAQKLRHVRRVGAVTSQRGRFTITTRCCPDCTAWIFGRRQGRGRRPRDARCLMGHDLRRDGGRARSLAPRLRSVKVSLD